MPSNPLADYLGQVKSNTEKELSSRQKQVIKWQKAVEKLYGTIKKLAGKKGKIRFQKAQLHEPDLGLYEIRILTMEIGPLELMMKPRGTIILGFQGRVDMRGPRGAVRILRMTKDRKELWYLCLNPDNPNELTMLDANSLALAFKCVIEGPHTLPRAALSSVADASPRSKKSPP